MEFELPIEFFSHTVQLIMKSEPDRWGNQKETTVDVHGVKFEPNRAMDYRTNGLSDDSRAMLYAHPNHTSFMDFEKDQEIECQEQRYVIRRIHTHLQPFSGEIHHIKLELV